MPSDEIPSVWIRTRGQREQPALSRERIASEALRILDTEGAEALSMRRLGADLNAGATSLYRHVANKDELFELVVDEAYGELDVPYVDQTTDWRAAATDYARNLRAMILRHPWLASAFGAVGLAYLGPNMMRCSDRTLGIFTSAGFDLVEADRAVSLVSGYVIGVTTNDAAWATTVARSGSAEREWLDRLRPTALEATAPYPRLRALYAAHLDTGLDRARQDTFDYGIERILDSLEHRLPAGDGPP